MDDITDFQGAPAPDAFSRGPSRQPAPPPADLATLMSDPVADLVASLAEANKSIRNPAKNRDVTVTSRRTNTTFSYSYATLDQVLDAVRRPLAEHGLIVTQLPAGQELVTLVLHKSGQWIRTKSRLMVDPEGGNQGYASALTYAKRIALMAILGVAGDEDDDGNAAAGNEAVPTHAVRHAIAAKAEEEVHPLVEAARGVKDANGAQQLLDLWLQWHTRVTALRWAPELELQQTWAAIVGEVAGALDRTMGRSVAGAWKALAVATEPAHLEAIAGRWDGAWAHDLAVLAERHPDFYELLGRHLGAARTRLRLDEGDRRAADHLAVDDEQTAIRQGAAAATMEAAQQPDGTDEPIFDAVILDEHGDVASEPYADPITWATDFRRRFEALRDPEAQRSLLQHNEEAVEAACQFAGALALLDNLEPTAASPAPDTHQEAYHVPLPMDRSGIPDLLAYLAALEASLGTVASPSAMSDWEEANAPTYKGDASIGSRTQMKVLQLVAQRKRALGIALPSPKAS